MAEEFKQETYGTRIEKKIDTMQNEIRTLSDHVTRLTFINEAYKTESAENRKDIDALEIQVTSLSNRAAIQDGSINIIRIGIGMFAGVVIGLCAWVGSSIIQLSKDQSITNEKFNRIEAIAHEANK